MTENIAEKLTEITRTDERLLSLFKNHIRAGSPLYAADFLLIGVAKRTLALSSGFQGLIKARNFTCAAALVRMQIDTALRIFAGTLVDSAEDYAFALLRGDAVNRMKDRNGRKMHDAHLVSELSTHYPWVKQVYKETSKLVHFTSRYIFASAANIDQESRTVNFQITAEDPPRLDSDYFEVIDGYHAAMCMTLALATGWQNAIRPPPQ